MDSKQRLALRIAVLTSFIPFYGESMITLLLPVIGRELGGGLALQQWIANGYMLTLGSFILIGGSISDLFGRLKILRFGLIAFGLISILCAIAPNGTFLIIARLVQGATAALLLPSSLALIADFIPGKQFSKAIGSRTAWTSIALLIGPLLGGLFVDTLNWRLAFAANLIPIIVTLWLLRRLSGSLPDNNRTHADIKGSLLCAIALSGIVFALIEQAHLGWSHPLIVCSLSLGLVIFAFFIRHEMRSRHPMLPLRLFAIRNFAMGNITTLTVYGGLTVWGFAMALFLQQVAGYSALASGLSLAPVTLVMFLGSARVGVLSQRFGPRGLITTGSLVAAAGIGLLALNIDTSVEYVSDILPGMLIFGLGVTLTATPLTAAVLEAVPRTRSGIASAVNNAVVSIAGLLAIAVIGIVLAAQFNNTIEKNIAKSDLSPTSRQALNTIKQRSPEAATPAGVPLSEVQSLQQILREASVNSYRTGMVWIATAVAAGGLIAMVWIRNERPAR